MWARCSYRLAGINAYLLFCHCQNSDNRAYRSPNSSRLSTTVTTVTERYLHVSAELRSSWPLKKAVTEHVLHDPAELQPSRGLKKGRNSAGREGQTVALLLPCAPDGAVAADRGEGERRPAVGFARQHGEHTGVRHPVERDRHIAVTAAYAGWRCAGQSP